MNILITTGVSSNEVGGPGQYSDNLSREFTIFGHNTRVVSYGREKKLPIGVRHLYFFFKIFPDVIWADRIITLDTFSVGLPSIAASKIFKRISIVRIGGDFLWETYINRTNMPTVLSVFYLKLPELSKKEKLILLSTRWLLRTASILVFNTEWQRAIWSNFYSLPEQKTKIIRNFMPEKRFTESTNKNLVWAGRVIPLKNLSMLHRAFENVYKRHPELKLDIVTEKSHDEVLDIIKDSYAVVLPSLSDVCPNFILEAASFGKPFIMTRETGIQEVLTKGGVFVNPLDQKEIETAIETMLYEKAYFRYKQELEDVYNPRNFKEVAFEFIAFL